MTDDERIKLVEEAQDSLRRMQDFDAETIARVDELGRELNFSAGVEPLKKTIALYREISLDVLPDMSVSRIQTVKQSADALFNQLQQILKFSTEGNPRQSRDQLLQQLVNGYDNTFEQLWPAIAYSVRRATDFSRMERGEKKYTFQECDLVKVARETAESYRPHLENQGFKFDCALPDYSLRVRGDCDALAQIGDRDQVLKLAQRHSGCRPDIHSLRLSTMHGRYLGHSL